MAKKFFAIIDGEQRGPFTLEEIVGAGVTPDTYVWCKGMTDWEPAKDNADICRVFRQHLYDVQHPSPDPHPAAELSAEDPYDSIPVRFREMARRSGIAPGESEKGGYDTSVPPRNYIVLSVLVTFLCCPIGLVALYYAIKVSRAWRDGQREEAYEFVRKTKMWLGISVFLGFVQQVIIYRLLGNQ